MAVASFIAIAISILFVFYGIPILLRFASRRNASREYGCLPPPSIPQRDAIFGLDVILQFFQALKENRRDMSMKQLFEVYGHTFQSKSWTSTKIYTTEPRNLQAIFATDFVSWGVQPMRLFGFEPFVGKGIMCVDGTFWEQSRAMIKPTFARAQIADLHLAAFAVHVDKLLGLLPKDGSVLDLQPFFSRLALDSSTEFLFGESVGSLSPNTVSIDAKSFLEAYDYGQTVVGRRLHLPQWNILTRDKRFRESCRIAHEFVESYIVKGQNMVQESREDGLPLKRYILAHELVKETGDLDNIRNQLLNIFLPAHEAVGVALTNVFFNLARHPHVYTKLRHEILVAAEGQTQWTFEGLKSVRYLQHVINETFRLNPAIGTNTRMALQDTILPTGGGPSGISPVFVKEGDIVTTSFYALHRRQDLFGDDANIFRPERWETLRPVHWSYLTFGGGPRVCPAQQLALMEVGYTIVKMLQTFKEIENRDPVKEFIKIYKITTTSRNGAKVALLPA